MPPRRWHCPQSDWQSRLKRPPIDLEARKASVVNLESHISQREKRLAELGQDIVILDGRIKERAGRKANESGYSIRACNSWVCLARGTKGLLYPSRR
jgi:hypothetical protein